MNLNVEQIELFRKTLLRAKVSLAGPDGSRSGVDGWSTTVNAVCEAARKGIGAPPLALGLDQPPGPGASQDDRLRYAIWLLEKGRVPEAEELCHGVLEEEPTSHNAHGVLGNAFVQRGRPDLAIPLLRRALELNPGFEDAHSLLIFALDLADGVSAEEAQAERRRFVAKHSPGPKNMPPRRFIERSPDRPLRIGWLSGDFKKHSAMTVIAPVILRRRADLFKAYLYSGVEGAGDDLTRELEDSSDSAISTLGLSTGALAERIRKDRIDVLIDLSGYTSLSRLSVMAHEPAPVLISWGCGTGIKAVDWVLADRVVLPEASRRFYVERVLDLPSYFAWAPPPYLPELSPRGDRAPFAFGCFNRASKLSPRLLDAFASILAMAPGTRLVLKVTGLEGSDILGMLEQRLVDVGVDRRRLTVLGQTDHVSHLNAHAHVDLMLDPFPQTGGVTTCESLAMGVPVLTLAGETFAARGSAAILVASGFDDMVALSVDEYVAKAGAARAGAWSARSMIREKFLASPVGDVERFVRSVEDALRRAWTDYCQPKVGPHEPPRPPGHFPVA